MNDTPERTPDKPGSANAPCLEAALSYAALGIRVLPLHWVADGKCSCGDPCKKGKPGKHPLTSHGSHDATTHPDQIRAWWRKWPLANVGIATGRESGLWVIGPDGEQGLAEIELLQQSLGVMPAGPIVQSGSGGQHRYLRWPADDLPIKNSANHLGFAIDTRSEGGYVVAPPSCNDKGAYFWLSGCALGQVPLPDTTPAWLA